MCAFNGLGPSHAKRLHAIMMNFIGRAYPVMVFQVGHTDTHTFAVNSGEKNRREVEKTFGRISFIYLFAYLFIAKLSSELGTLNVFRNSFAVHSTDECFIYWKILFLNFIAST